MAASDRSKQVSVVEPLRLVLGRIPRGCLGVHGEAGGKVWEKGRGR